MTPCRMLAALLLLCTLVLGGCAAPGQSNLAEVRQFADASVRLGGYGELARRYRDTYEREQPYLAPAADRIARDTDARRRAVYNDFLSIQKSVVLYMQTLALLAGADRYDLSARIDDLGAGIAANAESGLQQRHVAAYTGLTRLLTRVIASNYQNRSVETMVRDADADVQTLLEAMIALTRLYARTNDNEKKTVLGLFDVELPFSTRSADRMLATLARVHYLSKTTEYKLIDRRYDLALQGLARVAQGQQALRAHLDDLHGAPVRTLLAGYGRDLVVLRAALSD